jgi:aspartyl aminopeptidase
MPESFAFRKLDEQNFVGQTMANSMLVSADVAHAFNPNFAGEYLEGAAPALNVGVAIKIDPNMHYATNASGSCLIRAIAEKCGSQLQRELPHCCMPLPDDLSSVPHS